MGLYAFNNDSSFIVAGGSKEALMPNKCLEEETVQVSNCESCMLPLHCSLFALIDRTFVDHFDS